MVICMERCADLHMAQLMPLPLTVSCFSRIQLGLPFWYQLTWVVPDKEPLNGCVCVCAAQPVFRSSHATAQHAAANAGSASTGALFVNKTRSHWYRDNRKTVPRK